MISKYKTFWLSIESGFKIWSKLPVDKSETSECVEVIERAALDEACELLKDVGHTLRYRSSMPDANEQNLFLKIDKFLKGVEG